MKSLCWLYFYIPVIVFYLFITLININNELIIRKSIVKLSLFSKPNLNLYLLFLLVLENRKATKKQLEIAEHHRKFIKNIQNELRIEIVLKNLEI